MTASPLLRLRSASSWSLVLPLIVFGVLSLAGVLALPANAPSLQLFVLSAQFAAAIWGAWRCWQAASRTQENDSHTPEDAAMHRPWLMIAVALGCFALGVAVHFALSLQHPRPRWWPSSAHLFWAAAPLFLWLGLYRLAWLHLRRGTQVLGSLRVVVDTLIVVFSIAVLYWTMVVEPGLNLSQSPLSRGLRIYYPLADIISLFGAVLLLFAARGHLYLTRAAGLMWLAISCFIGTNALISYRALSPAASAPVGSALDLGWMWACLLIGVAALAHRRVNVASGSATQDSREFNEYIVDAPGEGVESERREQRWQRSFIIWLPYVAALAASAFLIWSEFKGGRTDAVLRMTPAMSLLFAVVARQMLTLRDNTQLSERLRNANLSLADVNSDLEKNVRERTQHLSTLHGITSTLNTSLDRRTVLRVALERTISATGADGGGIWLRVAEDDSPPDPAASKATQRMIWELAHSSGFGDNIGLENMLRDLAVAAAEEQGTPATYPTGSHLAQQYGFAPTPHNVVLVPIRWGGALLGTFGLLRHKGSFTYDDRALVESVALETGTALQNARLYQEARHRADRDSVTGLLNHRAIQERLNAELVKARRAKAEISVVMMDLNNFKFFNDTYGHPTGDEVLRTVARHLRAVCRESDVVGRYGGDEFIALLPQTDATGAQEFTHRVASRLNEHHFQADSGSRIPIEMAFGHAVYPRDADTSLELLTVADSNLYEYKHSGGLSSTPARMEASEQGRIEIRKLKNRAAGGSFGVLDALVTAIDNKDHYTRRHSEEVTHYSLLVAREMGYSEEALRAVRISGLLHDVGKIAVPDEILRHPGQLGPDEWDIMKQHPVFGALIVKDLPHLEEVLDGVRHHHERWDGKGYPDGLKETDIPVMGRLLAVGDCFSAMTTNRPYRKAFEAEDALREIERGIGIQFDPQIAAIFIKVMRRELAASETIGGDGAHKIEAPEELSDEIREEIALLPA